MNRGILILIAVMLYPLYSVAQSPNYAFSQDRSRSLQEEANTQTRRMVRELEITDSITIQRLYDLHLEFAKRRAASKSHEEDVLRMQEYTQAFKHILTEEQSVRFDSIIDLHNGKYAVPQASKRENKKETRTNSPRRKVRRKAAI